MPSRLAHYRYVTLDGVPVTIVMNHIPSPRVLDLQADPATGAWKRWMENYCAPTGKFDDLGTEWDWLNFFWGIYAADEDVRFDMDEIMAVWDGVKLGVEGHIWDSVGWGKAWCAPLSTIHNEKGWTCKSFPWTYVKDEPYTDPDGSIYDFFPIMHYPTEYEMGETWDQVLEYARTHIDFLRAQHFETVGRRAGVDY